MIRPTIFALPNPSPASRLSRWPLVLLLAVGLLISLMHCAGCGLAFAGSDTPTIAATGDGGSTPDFPDQALPMHAGHCLSHVAPQAIATIALPIDHAPQRLRIAAPARLRTLAGLPPFKPPRA